MSNEQDSPQVKGVLIPLKPPVVPTSVQGFEFESMPGQVIDIRTDRPIEPPSTSIIYAEDDDIEKFGDTVEEYAKAAKIGSPMVNENIPNATRDTGGIAVKVPQLTLPAGITLQEGRDVIRNEKGTVWVDASGIKMIITSIKNPTHPATGEMMPPPTTASEIQAVSSNTNNLLQFPQNRTQTVENTASQPTAPENTQDFDAIRANSPFFKKAA